MSDTAAKRSFMVNSSNSSDSDLQNEGSTVNCACKSYIAR